MKIKIAALVNYLAAIILMVMGIIYLTRPSFMHYHGEAIASSWDHADNNTKFLILALMRGVSGGLLSVSVTIMYLQFKFTHSKVSWIPGLILIAGILLSATILYAMIIVKSRTPGNPPIFLTVSGTILLIGGFFLNRKDLKNSA